MGYRFLRREVSFFLVVTVTPLLGITCAASSSWLRNGRGRGIWLQLTSPFINSCVADLPGMSDGEALPAGGVVIWQALCLV